MLFEVLYDLFLVGALFNHVFIVHRPVFLRLRPCRLTMRNPAQNPEITSSVFFERFRQAFDIRPRKHFHVRFPQGMQMPKSSADFYGFPEFLYDALPQVLFFDQIVCFRRHGAEFHSDVCVPHNRPAIEVQVFLVRIVENLLDVKSTDSRLLIRQPGQYLDGLVFIHLKADCHTDFLRGEQQICCLCMPEYTRNRTNFPENDLRLSHGNEACR